MDMPEKTIKMIRGGGITIPVKTRKKYNLTEGDQLILIDDEDGFKLIPAKIDRRKS